MCTSSIARPSAIVPRGSVPHATKPRDIETDCGVVLGLGREVDLPHAECITRVPYRRIHEAAAEALSARGSSDEDAPDGRLVAPLLRRLSIDAGHADQREVVCDTREDRVASDIEEHASAMPRPTRELFGVRPQERIGVGRQRSQTQRIERIEVGRNEAPERGHRRLSG